MSAFLDPCSISYAWPSLACILYVCAIVVWNCRARHAYEHRWPKNNVFLLVIAHPDDECMFFAPTLLNLRRAGHVVHLLCFSSGNFDQQGSTRKRELLRACCLLGIPAHRVHIVDSPLIADDPTVFWNSDLLLGLLDGVVEEFRVNVILSFDAQGVSGHLNHISVYKCCELFQRTTARPVDVYALKTVCTVRKYLAFAEALLRSRASSSNNLRYLSSIHDLHKTCLAMAQHRSQLVWFRVLYLLYSRYVFLNDYARME